ncbi:MAG: RsmB/NOP family class I SAM-dependent RNA methyltransferase [Candidatus Bathyarchaeia archaeon]
MAKMLKDSLFLALKCLESVENEGLSERSALVKNVNRLKIKRLSTIKMAYLIMTETLRRLNFIDFMITSMLSKDALKKAPLIENFIRIYVFLTKFKRIGLKETIDLVRFGRQIIGWKELKPYELFLGKVLEISIDELIKDSKLNEYDALALQTFHPEWFVKYAYKLLGRNAGIKLLKKNLKPYPIYIRLNTLVGKENELLRELREESIIVEKVKGVAHVYRLISTKIPLIKSKSYSLGKFHIQDLSSCIAVLIIDPKPGDVILDVCAAPGSKTSLMAQRMRNRGIIYSIDYSFRRLNFWKVQMKRLSVKMANPIVADAKRALPVDLKADIVALDPPCSNTGLFAKTPLTKWRINPIKIHELTKIQWNMLENCADHVKNCGKLVYSTCSITLEENELLIERFLKLHPEFELASIEFPLGSFGFRGLNRCLRLFPYIHECNGFFIAKMIKKL